MGNRHKHADLIQLWAEGAEIEWRHGEEWLPTVNPSWMTEYEYRIKPKEPEWYEQIPAHGVLCWVKNVSSETPIIAVVSQYRRFNDLQFISEDCWKYATPLTNDEIREFLRGE